MAAPTSRHSIVRLAGFPFGLGMALVFVSGTLNRVMIVEFDLPASLVGLFFAVAFLVAPARAWLGHLSDSMPIGGKRREPYIALGAVVAALAIVAAVLIVENAEAMSVTLIGGSLVAFLAYALGYTLASNSFEALLADKFTGDQRPRAVTGYKIAMFAGIMLGAVGIGRALDPFSTTRLVAVVAVVMAGFAALAVIATRHQEPPLSPADVHAIRQDHDTPFLTVIRELVWHDPTARQFFVLVVLAVLGSLAQDVLLEPYGALVLEMSVAQTTRLTAIWGTGTILTMLLSGTRLIQRWGYWRVLRAGLMLNIGVFPAIILMGALGSVPGFMVLVFGLGLGTGLSMAGLLTAVIEYTTFRRAGLLMGVWGMAAEFGQTMGGLLGGIVVDAVLWLRHDGVLLAYGTVFAIEGVLLLVALALMSRVSATLHPAARPARDHDGTPDPGPVEEAAGAAAWF